MPVRPHLLVAVLALAFSSCGETPETPKITESQLSPGVSRTADTTVTVQSASVVQGNWQGLGVQWGAYPHCDTTNKAKGFTYGPLTQAQWDRITQRLDALRPGFMRFMIHTGWRYFDGLDASGKPIVDYENPEMKFLYKCLDYTKSRDITVLFGEWAPRWKKASGESVGPWVNIWNDYNETWADMIANLLHYLIEVKGYSNIKYYDMENEPYGSWSFSGGDWAKYRRGFVLLHNALVSKGIRSRIKLDCCWNGINAAQLSAISDYADLYDEHDYAGPSAEYQYASARSFALGFDPTADGMLLGETGIPGTVDYHYAHTSRDSAADDAMIYDYGWWMANRAVQAMRDGLLTLSAWELDDALFTIDDEGVDLKRWGMWDSVGGSYSGDASLENLRPWFYSWAILGNNFPKGTRILETGNNSSAGIHSIGGKTPDGFYSVAIVNTNSGARSVNVVVDGGPTASRVRHYVYFPEDRPVDSNSYPIPKQALNNVNSQTGVTVTLPGSGLVVLSFVDSSVGAHGVGNPSR